MVATQAEQLNLKKYDSTRYLAGNVDGCEEAAQALLNGACVALPTETVYGLFARADLPEAVRAIFAAKDRPANHPLIVHVADVSQFSEWAAEVPDVVYRLAKVFCPGALSFILPMREGLDQTVTGGQAWVALRIPSHPLTLSILRATGLGLAGPSANRFGRISPTSAEDVLADLDGRIYGVLDGGRCQQGIESTIIKVENNELLLLRPGQITPEQLAAVSGYPVRLPVAQSSSAVSEQSTVLRVSGNLESHYAPVKPAWRISYDDFLRHLANETCFLSAGDWVISHHDLEGSAYFQQSGALLKQMSSEAEGYAHELYTALRDGDRCINVQRLWIVMPPADMAWLGVRDRVIRATREWVSQIVVEAANTR